MLRRARRALERRTRKLRPAAEEQPVVGRQPEVMEKVTRVEGHPAPWQKLGGEGAGQRRSADDVAADRDEPSLQRRRRLIRVAVGGNQHVPRAEIASRGRNCPAGRGPRHPGNRSVLENGRTSPRRGARQPVHVFRRVDGGALFVDEQPVITTSAKLRRLIASFDDGHLVIEHSSEQRLLLAEGAKVTGLGGRLKVSRSFEIAVDRFVGNDAFERGHRLAGDLEQLARPCLAVRRDQSPRRRA